MSETATKERLPLATEANLYDWLDEAPSFTPQPVARDTSEPPAHPGVDTPEARRYAENARAKLTASGDPNTVKPVDQALQGALPGENVVDFIERHASDGMSPIRESLRTASRIKAQLRRAEEHDRWWEEHERQRRRERNEATIARGKGKNSEAAQLVAQIDSAQGAELELDRMFRLFAKAFEARRLRAELESLKRQVNDAAKDQGVEPPDMPDAPAEPAGVAGMLKVLLSTGADAQADEMNGRRRR